MSERKWRDQFVGCTDMSNIKHYSKIIHYIKMYFFYTPWIWENFISPEEILSETIIYLADKKIEYATDSDILIKNINRRISFLWHKYLKEHPVHYNYLNKVSKINKIKYRKNLSDPYLIDIAVRLKGNKDWGYEIQKIDSSGNVISIYSSIYMAAKENNIDRKWMWEVITGKKKSARGFLYIKKIRPPFQKQNKSRLEIKNDKELLNEVKERIIEKRRRHKN